MATTSFSARIGMSLRPLELLRFCLVPAARQPGDIRFVTGADRTHFRSLCQLLESLRRYEPACPVVAWDLGMEPAQRDHVVNGFPSAAVRSFDYARFPDWFDIRHAQGQYAWKPVIVWDAVRKAEGLVCWMDAGNVVTRPLTWLRRITRAVGMYAARSTGCIDDWTHPDTLDWLGAADGLRTRHNLSASLVAVDTRNAQARAIMRRWKDCAMERDCIAPAGSDRRNHRQDQAVLSVIAHQYGIAARMPRGRYGFKIQQDVD